MPNEAPRFRDRLKSEEAALLFCCGICEKQMVEIGVKRKARPIA
jgi:hypothetical protein